MKPFRRFRVQFQKCPPRLVLPPPTPSSVEVLGEGPAAASAVVDLFERLGVLAR